QELGNKALETIEKLSAKFDTLKYFIKLLWEMKEIDSGKLSSITIPLTETGKMIGGWIKLYKQTPSNIEGE
ncbi:TPA: hypothetical protein DDY56_03905, partial [Candidatus Uhrbacteria bacterium]|nr:hypothetical protein [Candidatus Uhrbacteria bacterium]HAN06615.1 hypothetical protein [Candidatus Uhrbacteria bacterium]HAP65605.1 hypothetical protein [Candidatus Uhrbacteria bacterium]HBA52120.1 hypothetical protein [Candidatus Uhrbacteria bacterium]HBC40130.1 hypothetical protein [Candidatus Uhrbacteria bacterium]